MRDPEPDGHPQRDGHDGLLFLPGSAQQILEYRDQGTDCCDRTGPMARGGRTGCCQDRCGRRIAGVAETGMSQQDDASMFRSTMQNPFLLLGIAVAIGFAAVAAFGFSPQVTRGAVVAAILAPVIEYFIHRFISHGRWMYQFKPTSSIWKRIHYDHHQNPANPAVLLAAPDQVIGGSLMFSIPIGLIAGGDQGASAAPARRPVPAP